MSGQLGVSFLFLLIRVVYVKWSPKDADNWFFEENEAALSASVTDSEIVSFLIQRRQKMKPSYISHGTFSPSFQLKI